MKQITGSIVCWLLLSSLTVASGPPVIRWEQLRDVQFKKKWYPEESVVMLYPKFGPTVKALNGKAISITGYVIPIDLESGLYVVSEFPMAACFFCGAAGPESIMTLKFKRLPRKFRTDERRTFSGTLRLNADNIYELNYILDGAELQSDNS
ncbi:DUF3299 domain-containing protein [Spirosoma aerolatum]|uniref:DUF3299 domain-containing protein n=1 Tax=Spirosoma aerolatum TaxID=1211326 RepID=UPI0009AC4170|nr:DUF3299 domain-containing protein [Spirosoma aerolatum]